LARARRGSRLRPAGWGPAPSMGSKADLETPVGRRHIIERPRLTRLLDETSARVIMLVAPAGYGKTTLARQWLANRPHAWYQASAASSDVAALAAGLMDSSPASAPGSELSAWLSTTREPQHEIETLAALLSEYLDSWPSDLCLAIDDYHSLTSSGSEDLFNRLLDRTTFPVLIASRTRPSWATPRRLLYGELAEFGQHALAMNNQEAEDVLSDSDGAAARALLGLANGWPAVIGLASFADLSALLEQDGLPTDLHDYVAEELYALLSRDIQFDLCRLALLPDLSQPVIDELLGNRGDLVLSEGQRAGFLVAIGTSEVDLHPLLRSFLLHKFLRFDRELVTSCVDEAVSLLTQVRAWEDAFSLVCRFHRLPLLDAVVSESLDELVQHGRIETLKRWVDRGRTHGLHSPALDLLEAEYCFRAGRHDRAKILAKRAGEQINEENALASRAFYRAGQNAHLTESPDEALSYFARARDVARTTAEMQDALWGEFVTTVELEREGAAEILRQFEACSSGTIDELVRTHNGRLYLATRRGFLPQAIEAARPIAELAPEARDPVVRVSFVHIYSGALRLTTNYAAARDQVALGLREAEVYHLDFARPHMLLTKAAVHVGFGEYAKASGVLDRVDELSLKNGDEYLSMSTAAIRSRLLMIEGAFERALEVTEHSWPGVRARGQRAEYQASRALALMSLGERRRGEALLEEAETISAELEPVTLCDWVRTLFALREDEQASERVEASFERTIKSGLTDTFVFAYRADSRILELLTTSESACNDLAPILLRANDRSRGRAVGLRFPPDKPSAIGKLSPRERDVFALLSEGRSNKEIAAALFLSEVTVKVHVRSILRKLGVRSRTEAAVLGARTPVR
jgi:LuxR family maltose regulon positive regulatory protein